VTTSSSPTSCWMRWESALLFLPDNHQSMINQLEMESLRDTIVIAYELLDEGLERQGVADHVDSVTSIICHCLTNRWTR